MDDGRDPCKSGVDLRSYSSRFVRSWMSSSSLRFTAIEIADEPEDPELHADQHADRREDQARQMRAPAVSDRRSRATASARRAATPTSERHRAEPEEKPQRPVSDEDPQDREDRCAGCKRASISSAATGAGSRSCGSARRRSGMSFCPAWMIVSSV